MPTRLSFAASRDVSEACWGWRLCEDVEKVTDRARKNTRQVPVGTSISWDNWILFPL